MEQSKNTPAEEQEDKGTQQNPTTGQPTTTETDKNAPESDEQQEASSTTIGEGGEVNTDDEALKEAAPVEEAELV